MGKENQGQITELLIPAGTNQACAAIQLIEQASAHRSYIKIFSRKHTKTFDLLLKVAHNQT